MCTTLNACKERWGQEEEVCGLEGAGGGGGGVFGVAWQPCGIMPASDGYFVNIISMLYIDFGH